MLFFKRKAETSLQGKAYVTRMGRRRRKVKKRWAGLDSKQARRFTKPV